MTSASVTTAERHQSRAKRTKTPAWTAIQESQIQFPEIPRPAMIPVIASGVSAAKVVAAMLTPAHHQGRERSARK
jgi:hypothetical protein